ncbi:MAG TPA: TerC family protein [Candidatus Limnocylindria bacterium]|nr:TerC family protein [Candidatus Limnocylindria bacterium]
MPELGGDVVVALLTLTAMEIVLGVDNVVFISILTGRLPADQAKTARRVGLALALAMRIGLLLAISWVMSLTQPLFTLIRPFSGRDLILLGGGLVLIGKATWEIYDKLEVVHEKEPTPSRGAFALVIGQILVMDIVFSLDSVITAVGMANEIWVMVTAMVIAVGVMLVSADAISRFVEAHPSVKILALSFLLLIGVMLVAEGTGQHVGKGYIYAAMAFSLLVELLNLRYRQKRAPLALHGRFEAERQEARPA